MQEFLNALTSYPAVLCTVLLGVALAYWALVLVGALGGDAFGGPDADADVDADHGDDATSIHDAAAALGLFGGLRRIPTGLAVTLVSFLWWLENLLLTHYLGPALSAFAPDWIWGSAALVVTLPFALIPAGLVARLLVPIFTSREGARRADFVGSIVEVRTGRVDRVFGQAQASDGGAGLLLEVRGDPSHKLARGDRAIVIAYDQEREFYEIAPLDDLLEK